MKKEAIFNKYGVAIQSIARCFIVIELGSKVPTIRELETKIKVARGTIQNALKVLEQNKAIRLQSRGVLGSYLIEKDMKKLIDYAHITYLVGVMPLPYSKRYEGLATGLISEMGNRFHIPVHMAYMNGAKKRIEMVLNERYDFTIISKYAAQESMRQGQKIIIAKELGLHSYLGSHIIAFADPNKKVIQDGMRIGIDEASIDQETITKKVCEHKHVTYVKLAYNQIIEKILKDEIDAAVWNEDEIDQYREQMGIQSIPMLEQQDDTVAVLAIRSDRPELSYLIKESLDVEKILQVQKQVMQNKMIPNY